MKIYTLVSREQSRVYKFAVYANSQEEAVSHMRAMYRLFIEHYSQLEQAKVDLGATRGNSSEQVVNEAKRLVGRVFDFDIDTVRLVEDEDNHYLVRHFGKGWCVFAVFDAKTEKQVCQFNLHSSKFNNYPETVKKEIKEYRETNEHAVSTIKNLVNEFFKLNPKSSGVQDVVKLRQDYQHLDQLILNQFDWYKLSNESRNEIRSLREYIDAKQVLINHAVNNDPLFKQFTSNWHRQPSYSNVKGAARHQLDNKTEITPLMYAVERLCDSGGSIKNARMNAMKSSQMLLEAGAEVNATDCWGRTPLMYVVLGRYIFGDQTMPGREQLARLLVEYGADPSIKDNEGKSVIDYFVKECEDEINHPAVSFLRRAEELRNMANAFTADKLSNEAVDALNTEDLMHFIFYLAYEFKSQSDSFENFSVQSMNYIRAKAGEVVQSTYFASLSEETRQHFSAVSLFTMEPALKKSSVAMPSSLGVFKSSVSALTSLSCKGAEVDVPETTDEPESDDKPKNISYV